MIEAIRQIGKWQIVFTVWHRNIILRKAIKTLFSSYGMTKRNSGVIANEVKQSYLYKASSPSMGESQSSSSSPLTGEDRGEGVKNE